MQPQSTVAANDGRKPFIDVMENVFAGVRIVPDDEPRSRVHDVDLRARPWLAGVTMSAVQVTLTDDRDEDDKDKPDF